MDRIILGLLMIGHLTIYELRNIIKSNLQGMCSDSMGSIQAAIKKLLANEMITYNEFVENGVNKKVYSITPIGAKYFSEWVCTPINMGKTKNMELSKLFFMGLVPREKRIDLIDKTLIEMKEELAYLTVIKNSIDSMDDTVYELVTELSKNSEHVKLLLESTTSSSLNNVLIDIVTYSQLTLKFGLDMIKYEIEWVKDLKRKLEKGENPLE